MTHDEIIKYFGNTEKAAASLDVTSQTIRRWRKFIPLNAQKAIAYDTKNTLKVKLEHSIDPDKKVK